MRSQIGRFNKSSRALQLGQSLGRHMPALTDTEDFPDDDCLVGSEQPIKLQTAFPVAVLNHFAEGKPRLGILPWGHVQNQLGILTKVQEAQSGMDKAEANALQVRVELQADCLAGVWANRAQAKWQFIEPGDVEAALQTASAIGDDRLQRRTQGYVVPDAFTHGTSAQRVRWFMTGFKSGAVGTCDTFRVEQI
jgi:Putative neutral zinc metallopeptidase